MIRMQDGNAKVELAPLEPRSRQLRLELMPSFEAAARHLSFTRAGAELSLSQSAISRQIQQLEESVGVPLFERRHRALALTPAGRIMQRAVEDSLERLRDAAARVRASTAVGHHVAVTCTPGFASFWLIPRLARFTAAHPAVDVRISATLDLVDLDRSSIDLAVRFVPIAQGRGPVLFEEQVQPMCSPLLLRDPARPLRSPADLAQHTLLTLDIQDEPMMDWDPWLQLMGIREMQMAHTIRFSQYNEAVTAAVAGHGIVIGRFPLLADLLRQKKLVAPFRSPAASLRGHFVTLAAHAAHNPDAHAFAEWLLAEAEDPQAKTRRA